MSFCETSSSAGDFPERIMLEKRLLAIPKERYAQIPRTSGLKPLSFAQEGIWYYEQLLPNSPLYIIPQAFRLRGALDQSALRRAFQFVLDRHQALRTKMVVLDGQPLQTTHSDPTFEIAVVDLCSLEEALKERQLTQLIIQEATLGFKLCEDLLIRAKLIKCAQDDHVLLLSLHHIISDFHSLDILYDELGRAYTSFHNTGRAPVLLPLPFDLRDLAVVERRSFEE